MPPTPPSSSPAPPLRHGLKAYFASYKDEDLIEELDRYPSSRAWADENLLRAVSALHDGGLTHRPDLHGALLYYLRTHRPGVMAVADHRARELAVSWPRHRQKLTFFEKTSFWRNMVRTRFSKVLCERYPNRTAEAWTDIIWPTVLRLLALTPRLKHLSPSACAEQVLAALCFPTAPKHRGKTIYKAIQKELRHRLKSLREGVEFG